MRAPRTRGGAPMSTSELYPGVGVCLVVKGNVKLESLLGSWEDNAEADDFGHCENVSRWTDRRNYSTESIAGELSHPFAEGTHLGAGMLKFGWRVSLRNLGFVACRRRRGIRTRRDAGVARGVDY